MANRDDGAAAEATAGAYDLERLARGTLWGIGGRLGGRTAALAANALAARRFGPARYGLFSIALLVARIGGFAATLSLDRGLVRFGSPQWDQDQRQARSTVGRALTLVLLSGAVTTALVVAFAGVIASAVFRKPEVAEVLRLVAPALLLLPLLRASAAASTIGRAVRDAMMSEEFAQPVLYLVGVIVFFLVEAQLGHLVVLYVSSHVAGLVVAVYALRRMFRSVEVGAGTPVRALLHFSLVTHVGSLMAIGSSWGDRLIISALLPPREVGIYNGAGQLAFAFDVVATGIGAIILPLVASLHAAGDTTGLRAALRAATRWGIYVTIPPFLVACMEPGAVITLIIGAPYAAEGAAPLSVLCAAHLLNVTGVGYWLQMTDAQRAWSVLSAAGLAVQIVAAWLLIPRFGLVGAAVGALIALALLDGLGLVVLWTRSRIVPFDRFSLRLLVAAAIAAGGIAGIRTALTWSSGPRIVVVSIVAVVLFYGSLALMGMHPEDREIVRSRLRR
jgi:O-antigen/teichoic acid export membrane protein